jgi:hypothetical protein
LADESLPGARRISQGIEPHEFIELRIVDVRDGCFIVTEQIDEGVFSFRPVHRQPAAGCSAIAAATQRQQQQHERELNVECRDDRHGQRLLLRRLLAKCEGEWQQRNRPNRESPKGDLTPKAPGRL